MPPANRAVDMNAFQISTAEAKSLNFLAINKIGCLVEFLVVQVKNEAPVSYTHLDVYKRQKQGLGGKIVVKYKTYRTQKPHPREVCPNMPVVITVSYTHLDVN